MEFTSLIHKRVNLDLVDSDTINKSVLNELQKSGKVEVYAEKGILNYIADITSSLEKSNDSDRVEVISNLKKEIDSMYKHRVDGQIVYIKPITQNEIQKGDDFVAWNENDIEKGGSHVGLVQRKIQIKMKNGTTYTSMRWVDPETDNHLPLSNSKYQNDTSPENAESVISSIVNHPSLKPIEKVRQLVGHGIYSKEDLVHLSDHKYPSDIVPAVRKETDINIADYPSAEFDGEIMTSFFPTEPTIDYGSSKVQSTVADVLSKNIYDIQEEGNEKLAYELQNKKAKQILEELGLGEPTVKEKWADYETSLENFLKRGLGTKSLMAYGTGGIGKTFTFNKVADKLNLREFNPYGSEDEEDEDEQRGHILGGPEYDYVTVTGRTGINDMQRIMFEHRNKTIVFDDCDSMWDPSKGLVNILKGALDTSGDGKINWGKAIKSKDEDVDDIPSSYKFSGKMIFITNLSKKKLNDWGAAPIVESRAKSMDLSMTAPQTLDRLEDILPHIKIKDSTGKSYVGLEDSDKQIALDVLKKISPVARMEQLNTRVLGHIIGEAISQREDGNGHNFGKLIRTALTQLGAI